MWRRPFGLHVRVEAVDRAGVVVVQPRREDPQAPELAPPLMGEDVVRVVRAGPVVAILSDDLSRDETARDDSHRPIGLSRRILEPVLDVRVPNRAPVPVLGLE
jgi:hypothetical protein